jgi:hypothetical protein
MNLPVKYGLILGFIFGKIGLAGELFERKKTGEEILAP